MIVVGQFAFIEKVLFYFNLCLTPINGNPQRLEDEKIDITEIILVQRAPVADIDTVGNNVVSAEPPVKVKGEFMRNIGYAVDAIRLGGGGWLAK